MSGPKKVDVQLEIDRAVSVIRQQMATRQSSNPCHKPLDFPSLQEKCNVIRETLQSLQPFSEVSSRFAEYEIKKFKKSQEALLSKIENCLETMADIEKSRSAEISSYGNMDAEMQQLEEEVKKLMQDVRRGAGSLNRANQLRDKAVYLCAQQRKSFRNAETTNADYLRLEEKINQMARQMDGLISQQAEIENKAAERRQERIAENNLEYYKGELKDQLDRVVSGENAFYATPEVSSRIAFLQDKYETILYDTSSSAENKARDLAGLIPEIGNVEQKLEELHQVKLEEISDLTGRVKALREEFDLQDLDNLSRYVGDTNGFSQARAKIDQANSFLYVSDAKSALRCLEEADYLFHKLKDEAEDNIMKCNERTEIEIAFFDAIKAMNLPTPELCADSDSLLAGHTFYVKMPGDDTSFMTFHLPVGITKQDAEVFNVEVRDYDGSTAKPETEGSKTQCVRNLLQMKEKMRSFGIDFDIKDWNEAREQYEKYVNRERLYQDVRQKEHKSQNQNEAEGQKG